MGLFDSIRQTFNRPNVNKFVSRASDRYNPFDKDYRRPDGQTNVYNAFKRPIQRIQQQPQQFNPVSKQYWAPKPQITTRDYVREMPGALRDTGGQITNFAKNIPAMFINSTTRPNVLQPGAIADTESDLNRIMNMSDEEAFRKGIHKGMAIDKYNAGKVAPNRQSIVDQEVQNSPYRDNPYLRPYRTEKEYAVDVAQNAINLGTMKVGGKMKVNNLKDMAKYANVQGLANLPFGITDTLAQQEASGVKAKPIDYAKNAALNYGMGFVGSAAMRMPGYMISKGKTIPAGLSLKSEPPKNAKTRGLVTSIQEAGNISAKTKKTVGGEYVVKKNKELMGEAKALLSEGATINFKGIEGVDKKVAATIQEAINLDKAGKSDAAAALYNNLSEHGTELGKGVQALSMLPKMSPQAISLSIAGKIKRFNADAGFNAGHGKIPEMTGEQVKMVSEMIDGIQKLPKGRKKNLAVHELDLAIKNMIPSTVAEKFITTWKAGLLTSLRTHERNLIGSSGMGVFEVLKDVPAAGADKIMSLKTGKRTMTATLRGLREFGSKRTRQEIKDIVFRGDDIDGALEKFDTRHITWGNNKVEQALKHYTNAVFRTLSAEDRPFYNAAFGRSLYDQAGAAAKNANKSGNKAFIKKLVNNPTEDMVKIATQDAQYATFHDKNALTGLASQIKQWSKKRWYTEVPAEVIAPFTGVPSSIVGKTIAYSPIGLVKGSVDAGRVLGGSEVEGLQRKAAQEIGRGVMGSGLFGLGALLMNKGLMTGQPKDKKEADLWAAQGKQANSVLVGGKWRSINSIGPQQIVMLAGGKLNESMNDPEGSMSEYAMALGKDQLSQTFLAGVQGPLNALTDPKRYGESYVGNQVASLVPNIIKDTAKAFDPYQREANNVLDYTQNSIPGLRNKNLPKRDVLGNVMKQEPTGPAAYFDVFNSKTPKNDPVANELARLYSEGEEAIPSKVNKKFEFEGQTTELSDEERNKLQGDTGNIMRPELNKLIGSDVYKSLSDVDKKAMIEKVTKESKIITKEGLLTGTSSTGQSSDYQKEMEKIKFKNSSENFKDMGDYVLRRSSDGGVNTQSKVSYNDDVYYAQLNQYKKADDLKSWMSTAYKKYDGMIQMMQDPTLDELEKIRIQNNITTLLGQIDKYKEYGGFKKGRTARGRKGGAGKISIKTSSSGKSPSIKKPKNITSVALKGGSSGRKTVKLQTRRENRNRELYG